MKKISYKQLCDVLVSFYIRNDDCLPIRISNFEYDVRMWDNANSVKKHINRIKKELMSENWLLVYEQKTSIRTLLVFRRKVNEKVL